MGRRKAPNCLSLTIKCMLGRVSYLELRKLLPPISASSTAGLEEEGDCHCDNLKSCYCGNHYGYQKVRRESQPQKSGGLERVVVRYSGCWKIHCPPESITPHDCFMRLYNKASLGQCIIATVGDKRVKTPSCCCSPHMDQVPYE